MTRLIDADKLRDSFGSHAYTRAAIKLRIDAAPTVCCESCRHPGKEECFIHRSCACTHWREATDDAD